MANTIYGVGSPVPLATSGTADENRLYTPSETETVKTTDVISRVKTLVGGIGSATFSGLPGSVRKGVSWQDRGDGFSTITITYGGTDTEAGEGTFPDPDDPEELPGTRYTLEESLIAEPLLSFPVFNDLTDDEFDALKAFLNGDIEKFEELNSAFDPPTALYAKALGDLRRGYESIQVPTITLRIQGVTNIGGTVASPLLGKIVTPPGGFAATFGSSQNWLYAGNNRVSFGSGQIEFEQVYLGSGIGGWDPFYYG